MPRKGRRNTESFRASADVGLNPLFLLFKSSIGEPAAVDASKELDTSAAPGGGDDTFSDGGIAERDSSPSKDTNESCQHSDKAGAPRKENLITLAEYSKTLAEKRTGAMFEVVQLDNSILLSQLEGATKVVKEPKGLADDEIWGAPIRGKDICASNVLDVDKNSSEPTKDALEGSEIAEISAGFSFRRPKRVDHRKKFRGSSGGQEYDGPRGGLLDGGERQEYSPHTSLSRIAFSMPKKERFDFNVDYFKSGLADDFVMDNLHISSHAKMRAKERGSLEDIRRRPVLKGNTVVTYLPTINKPKFVSGELWSPTREGDIAVKSPLLFREMRPTDYVVNVGGHESSVIGKGGVVINRIQETYKVKVILSEDGKAIVSGDGDIGGAVAEITKIVKSRFVISTVDISGFEGQVIGRQGKVISTIREAFHVKIQITKSGKAHVSSVNKADVDGAVGEIEEIVNEFRLRARMDSAKRAEKVSAKMEKKKQIVAATIIASWWRYIRGLPMDAKAGATKKKKKKMKLPMDAKAGATKKKKKKQIKKKNAQS